MQTLDRWLDYIGEQHAETIDMGLERMARMVERLEVARPAPSIVTVAGTNGKGSTCVALEQLLLAHGRRVGTTLSPHVLRFNERVRIDGAEATDEALCAAFAAVDAARGDIPLTYFEFAALAALHCMREAEVDVAILEIGLGGRLDAFNALDADVAVITSIGLDHQEYLGETLAQIGLEKAGILRAGQRVVLGERLPQSVLDRCAALGIEPMVCGVAFEYLHDGESTWSYRSPTHSVEDIELGAVAAHNLALALAAAGALVALDPAICRAVAPAVTLPGRLQQLVIAGRTYVLDVAHNPDGARFMCAELARRGIEPDLIVCGMLRGKSHADVQAAVRGELTAPWAYLSTHGDRAYTAAELAAAVRAGDCAACLDDYAGVLELAESATRPGDVILVFGSFNAVEQGVLAAQQQTGLRN